MNSWVACTGAHHTPSRSKISAHSAIGRWVNSPSSSCTSAAVLMARSKSAAKRGSSARSGRPTARSTFGQWRSPSEAEEPEPAAVAGAVVEDERVGSGAAGDRHRGQPGAEVDAVVPAEHVRADSQERRADQLALAGALPHEQGGGHGAGGGHAGHVVAHAAALVRQLAPLGREGGGHARARPERPDVVGGPAPLVALQAEAGHAGVDEARVAGGERGVVEPGPLEGVDAEVGHEDVGAGDQVGQHGPAGVGAVVDADRALPPVVQLERRVHVLAGGGGEVGAHPAERVADERLHLHHVGPPVGQDRGAARSGHPEPDLDDLDALHRPHRNPPSRSSMPPQCWRRGSSGGRLAERSESAPKRRR